MEDVVLKNARRFLARPRVSVEQSVALGDLLARYLPALRAFLISELRLDAHRAEDLLQGFVAERVVEQNLLARADQRRGRFRTFLLACLRNHVGMQRRHEAAAARHPGQGRLARIIHSPL